MKRNLLFWGMLVLCCLLLPMHFAMAEGEEPQGTIDPVRAQELYDRYGDLIEQMEKGNFEVGFDMLRSYFSPEKVTITKDNLLDYFEWSEKREDILDAYGEVSGAVISYYLRLKERYEPIDVDQWDIQAVVSYNRHSYTQGLFGTRFEINFDDLTFGARRGKIHEELEEHLTLPVTVVNDPFNGTGLMFMDVTMYDVLNVTLCESLGIESASGSILLTVVK